VRPSRSKLGLIRLTVVLLLISAVALVCFVKGFVAAEPAGRIIRTALYPLQRAFAVAYEGIAARVQLIRDYERILAENELLRQQVQEMRLLLVKYDEVAAENERLRALHDYSEQISYETIAARVIARDPHGWRDHIVIDKGTANGIAKNDAVLGSHGLIGRVVSASLNSSVVMLISDPQSSLSGRVQDSRSLVVVEGTDRTDGLIRFDCLESGDKVQVGDLVITSGLGGVFPPGLPIGEVYSVEKDFYGIADTGLITPASNLLSIESVLVIIGAGV